MKLFLTAILLIGTLSAFAFTSREILLERTEKRLINLEAAKSCTLGALSQKNLNDCRNTLNQADASNKLAWQHEDQLHKSQNAHHQDAKSQSPKKGTNSHH